MEPNPKDPIDPTSFLLPKKDAPPPAQRINAGVLLEQEISAKLPEKKSSDLPSRAAVISGGLAGQTFSPEVLPASNPVPAPPVAPKPERSEVSPLQTYKSDVEKSVEDRGVSVVSVAAAEAERRGKQGQSAEAKKEARKVFGMNLMMVLGGVVLIALAVGAVAFMVLRPGTVAGPQVPVAPFISVDETALVLADTSSRDALATNIAAGVQGARLSLGLIKWLYVAPKAADGSVLPELPAQELLGVLASNLPPELARTLQPSYLLGVHSFDQNQAFLLLQTDSYETAYSGMLAWERTMRGDLSPIFNRTPSPRVQADASVGSPTSTSVGAQATSTQQFIQTNFVDKVVENRDTRALLNEQGDILLLWTMLGRNIILITTNEYTLREVVSRMNVAPIVPIPGR